MNKLIRIEIRVLNADDDESEAEGFEEYFVNTYLPDDWDDEQIKDEIESLQRCVERIAGAS